MSYSSYVSVVEGNHIKEDFTLFAHFVCNLITRPTHFYKTSGISFCVYFRMQSGLQ